VLEDDSSDPDGEPLRVGSVGIRCVDSERGNTEVESAVANAVRGR
jgi:hypothetical protein